MMDVSIDHETYVQALRNARTEYPGLSDENAMSFYVKKVLAERFIQDEINEAIRHANIAEPPGVSIPVKQRKR